MESAQELLNRLHFKGWKNATISSTARITIPTLIKIVKGGDCRFSTYFKLKELEDQDPPVRTKRLTANAALKQILNALTLEEAQQVARAALK